MLGSQLLLPVVLLGAPAATLDREVLCMGTRLGIHLEGPGLPEASARILQEMARIERACSTWDPGSRWSALNGAKGAPVALDREWLVLLGEVQAWSSRTGGAFDPVLGRLLEAWGTRSGGRVPSPAQWERARRASGSGLLVLEGGTARLRDPEAAVEEGGFLKGYALDAARRAVPATAGWLDFGGQILAWGASREVAVADADDRRATRLTLVLPEGMSLASSGCAERGRHILDPSTGRPCPDWGAVAVVAGSGLEADVLSTALYVLGPERGLEWARDHGTAAAFLLHGGAVRETEAFAALKAR
ncbi:FAD:protein FMN transferase [Mesoterricola silvestris]|uniref:FAD:protein FMN transferase n=1 Tax=Mesoterricola silvestris TaxID=2927979 RepID=A0AA48GP05_9BACT|nr:FAD:protein FMN transferase [Mesoterricola silvestris]BDU73030.1 FAD:protein FMN transferase [Mesoterricola silvestris]